MLRAARTALIAEMTGRVTNVAAEIALGGRPVRELSVGSGAAPPANTSARGLPVDDVSGQDYRGVMQGDGVVLVEIAALPGSSGTVLVDIRRADGGGGSLRAARASVDYAPDRGRSVQHAHLCVPVGDREAFMVSTESFTVAPPRCYVRTYVWPTR